MRILCIGDSLTYGYGVSRSETWCAVASVLTGHDFVNRGVNGAVTGEMDIPECFGDGVFIMGGLNDLFMGIPISVPLANIRRLCVSAAAKQMRPLVGIPMAVSADVSDGWCDGPIDMGKVRAYYAEYADRLLVQCKKDGIGIVDFRNSVGVYELLFDGIHPNSLGHRRMAEAVAAFYSEY